MHVVAYDDADKVFLSLPSALLGAALALVLGAAGGTILGGTDAAASSPRTSATAPAGPSLACTDLRPLADAALGEAVGMQKALQGPTDVVADLGAHRINGDDAAQRLTPALTAGNQHALRFDVALQRYRAAAGACAP